jgi:magnesium chelatase family protein
MVAKIKTFAFVGIEAVSVDVEVKISPGNPLFSIVGLPDKAVAESKERVRAAITSTGLSWPFQKITVNLAPADIQKEGTHFDLAIALGIMIEIKSLAQETLNHSFVVGELSLDGSINRVSGIISSAVAAKKFKNSLICPRENGRQAIWAMDEASEEDKKPNPNQHLKQKSSVIAASNLLELINHLKGELEITCQSFNDKDSAQFSYLKYPDLSEVRGQKNAKRALEIAACGGHNLLMIGPPGTGKSMLASRLPSILPPLTLQETLEINMIANISGKIGNYELLTNRPFREVHHSCSMAAMVGGGSKAKPGEVSLAHNGVLFLDELAEFPRQVLDSLRQPLETSSISISRANCHITYPANFQLICAMNPCRCGFFGDSLKQCKKAPLCAEEYKNKISGPLLDRIDLVVEVGRVDLFSADLKQKEECSSDVAKRVGEVRNLQKQRFCKVESLRNLLESRFNEADMQHSRASEAKETTVLRESTENAVEMTVEVRDNKQFLRNSQQINSQMDAKAIENFCQIDESSQKILQNFVNKSGSSMRAVNRILKVARTIADMEKSEAIRQNHLLEAISYRRGI